MWQCNCPNSTSGRLQGGHPTKYVYESPMSGLGQKAKYSSGADVFRFTPESGLKSDIAPCPKSANSGSHSILVATGRPPGRDVIRAARLAAILLHIARDRRPAKGPARL